MQARGVARGGVKELSYAELTRVLTAADVSNFADVVGDHNPIHLDSAYAATTPFGRPIAHGMLSASLFSSIFATQIPGAIYVSQSIKFVAPAFVGDEVRARVEVRELARRRAVCATTVTVLGKGGASDVLAVDGEAVVLLPKDDTVP